MKYEIKVSEIKKILSWTETYNVLKSKDGFLALEQDVLELKHIMYWNMLVTINAK